MKKHEFHHHVKIAEQLLTSLNCPRSLSLLIMIRYGEWDSLVDIGIDPLNYEDAHSFARAYQATKLLSKASWLPLKRNRRTIAIDAFVQAESNCAATNEVFRSVNAGRASWLSPRTSTLLSKARMKISQIVGPYNAAWVDFCNFGPGNDSDTAHGLTAVYNKLESPGSVGWSCYPYLNSLTSISSLGYLFTCDITSQRLNVAIKNTNKVTFVPKNAKTDRSIAVEPRWNIFFQKGMGAFFRRRLKRFGVDLDDQTVNQRLSLIGSRNGQFSTIDVKAASDTVSEQLVWDLFPYDWASVMDHLRSRRYTLRKVDADYEKWSSMGNGYTFEMESIIFFALASSVDENVSVFGDDLIVPSKSAPDIISLLRVCGFEVNTSKTFMDGPFRESCGCDSFNGIDVTPFYWKKPAFGLQALTLLNQISKYAGKFSLYRDASFKRAWYMAPSRVPLQYRNRGPIGMSTMVHSPLEEWNILPNRKGYDGWFLKAVAREAIKLRFYKLEPALISMNFSPSSDGYSVRERIREKSRTVFIPRGDEYMKPWSR
ncbi:TPA_asm: RNA-directed RNA polymerase [ssRNA phage Esthiorhiza.1_9]|uniref:RNA-directed RNA polymerase n=2 Tax=Fiersviridae TaxID=2842319 RepID=A0A8S5L4U3_9VIRU|nr:RNA-directed RNA polymerase [ssRNA phage Esthiorhiza.1_9]QDH89696.1 MAG: RNA-dependent RNA polymerase [Leviviridae sp.]DAD52218.1 TPA_asm: RNA-directed RNA polymerase [ssRNA phage Esthiorhiza.1_9]